MENVLTYEEYINQKSPLTCKERIVTLLIKAYKQHVKKLNKIHWNSQFPSDIVLREINWGTLRKVHYLIEFFPLVHWEPETTNQMLVWLPLFCRQVKDHRGQFRNDVWAARRVRQTLIEYSHTYFLPKSKDRRWAHRFKGHPGRKRYYKQKCSQTCFSVLRKPESFKK